MRFTTIDPLADHRKQVNMSPYAAFWNNPIKYVDPDGRFVIDPNATRKQKRAIRQAIRKVRKFVRNKDVQAAMQKFGQLDLKQLKADLKNGKGPLIKVANLTGAYGSFTPNTGSNELRVDEDLLKKQDEATGDKKKDYKFLTGVTILHENTHRGDDQNGVDYPGEEGSQMEQASFGVVVDETNMRSARENYPSRAKQARKDARAQAKKERVQRRKKRKTNTP